MSTSTAAICNGAVCNCPTGGCGCGTTVTRYPSADGDVYVIVVRSAPDPFDQLDAMLDDFKVEVKRALSYRLGAMPRRAAPERPQPRPSRRPAKASERIDWARLPRRSPRGI